MNINSNSSAKSVPMRGVSAHLDPTDVNGTRALNIRDTPYHLVKKDDEGSFVPVDTIGSPITSEELEADYGVWEDKSITKGHLWWKKTVREKDGQVQPDEVKNFSQFRDAEKSHIASRTIGADKLYNFDSADIEIKQTDDSGAYARMNTQWSLLQGNWSRYQEYVSPLAPPHA